MTNIEMPKQSVGLSDISSAGCKITLNLIYFFWQLTVSLLFYMKLKLRHKLSGTSQIQWWICQ